MSNILLLFQQGQSIWIDHTGRDLLTNGSMNQLVTAGIRGGINKWILLNKVFNKTNNYDNTIRDLLQADQEVDTATLYQWLLIQDAQMAAEILYPVYESSDAEDGYVSIEVLPHLAYDTQGILEAARHLWKEVDRPNLMLGIPGTREALPAIEHLLAEGINVNVTGICSLSGYAAAAQAYTRGVAMNANPSKVASVVSFLIRSVDATVEFQLDRIDTPEADQLKDKVAIANARTVYQHFNEFIKAEFFKEQQQRGARVQRLLWDGVYMEKPDYPDLFYVGELIGPHTVMSMTSEILDIFQQYGEVKISLEGAIAVTQAERYLKKLDSIGVGLERLMEALQREHVGARCRSYERSLSALKDRCSVAMQGYGSDEL